MKSLAPQDRPREKLDRLGPGALGDHELLALVVGHGCRDGDALAVASEILQASLGVQGLTRLSRDELQGIHGVGAAKASRILAAVELGRRTLLRPPAARPQFVSPRDAAAFLMPQYASRPVEQFGIVLLDTKHRVLKTSLLSIGTLDASLVHPREIFRPAAAAGAAALLLFHNHPSGDPTPSRDDLLLTRRLVAAGDLMGIDVVDHLILADGRYYSLKEQKAI